MMRRFWPLSLWVVLGAALLVAAYLIINTTFMLYDDEGYVLLTYQNFNAGGRLYDAIFSQYGPWPYVYHLLVGLGLHQTLTHEIGRNLTAFNWALCGLLAGVITTRVTGKMAAGIFATLATFGLLWQMSSEPSHPGSLISAMLAVTALAVACSHATERWRWLGAAIGLAAALLVLTKINIGVLLIAGAGVGALRLTAWPERWRRPAEFVAVAGLLLVPWGLMGKKLGEPWVLVFALQFTGAAAGLLWVSPPAIFGRRIPPRTWLAAAGVFLGALILVGAVVCARGTSFHALVQAVLIDPLRHPASFMIGFTWGPYIWPVAAVCWAATLRAGWELRQHGETGTFTRGALIAIRFAAAVSFILHAEAWLTTSGVGRFIVYCLPLLPVFLVPLGRNTRAPTSQPQRRPRDRPRVGSSEQPGRSTPVAEMEIGDHLSPSGANLWVACLALPQVLHAYPVAGSQMGWGTFLLVPVLVAGLHDAGQALARMLPARGHWVLRIGWSILLLVGFGQLALLLHTGWTRYSTSKPLGLTGAEDIRAGDLARQTLRVMTLNAAVHADVLFSRPGMYSYNIWSGAPTPTARNATHWFWLLDTPAQQGIIDRLEQVPRSAVITSEGLDNFLESIHVPMAGPLPGYIRGHYRPLLTLGDFHFLVPTASRAVPFGQFELLVPAEGQGTTGAPALLRTNVLLSGRPASVQLQGLYAPWPVRENYLPPATRIILEPINSLGEPVGTPIELPAARPLRGLFRLNVYASHRPNLAHPREVVLAVLDPDGAVLSESVF